MAPSPVVTVNRAVAVGRADGPRAALALLAPVLAEGRLAGYAPLHAAHADLLERAGDTDGAVAAWRRAAESAGNPAERSALARRAAGR
jgi:RNA polymerase sigma-70 factor (ECF subfamily)